MNQQEVQDALGSRFTLVRELGRGGMAVVFLARDNQQDRTVAIKVLNPELAQSVAAERFLREIRLEGRLQHPLILPIFDSGRAGNLLYYVMPYVKGESLADRLDREGPLPVEDVIRIGREVAEALSYAHEHGVIHRDIKPGNILLSDGHAVVADFGVARALVGTSSDVLTSAGIVVGTPSYMSPEQAGGDRPLDTRSDLYSLGCVLFEMLAGEPPYTAPTVQALVAKHYLEPVPSVDVVRPSVPPGLSATVTKALAKVPADRFGSATELAEALTRPDLESDTPRGRRAFRRASLGTWLVLVVLAVGVGWLIANRFGDSPGPVRRSVPSSTVVVLPFTYHGPDSYRHLGGGMVGLLSITLDGIGDLRAVSPVTVLGMVDQQEGDARDPSFHRQVASRLGAGFFVVGNVVLSSQNSATITAGVYDRDSPQSPVATATVEGDASSELVRLVNTLAVRLLGAFGIQDSPHRLESISTASTVALNEYLRGEAALRSARFEEAVSALERAVEADSLFALAWYRLAYALNSTEDSEAAFEPARRAVELGHRLSERDRLLAQARFTLLDVSRAEEAYRLYKALLYEHPDDVEGQWGLADLVLHYGPLIGLPMDSVLEGFQRVLFYEPEYPQALSHLAWAAGLEGDLVTLDSTVDVLAERSPDDYWTPIHRAVRAFATGSEADRQRSRAEMASRDDLARLLTVNAARTRRDIRGASGLIDALLVDPTRLPEVQAFGHVAAAFLEVGSGRLGHAMGRLERASALDQAAALEGRALLLLAPFMEVGDDTLEAVHGELTDWDADEVSPSISGNPWISPHEELHGILRLYLLGSIDARLRRTVEAGEHADSLEAADEGFLESTFATVLARSVRMQILLRGENPTEALQVMESGAVHSPWERTYSSPFFSQSYERFLHADALQRLGRDREALRWLESVWMQNVFDQAYRAPSHLMQAGIYERLGELEKAADQYSAFLELWQQPDSVLAPIVTRARARLGALRVREP